MCSGNDSGNLVRQKTLFCDSLYRQNISTLEIYCQLMVVFGDSVLRLHHVGRGCREFNSGLASIIMIAHFRLADQEHVNTVQVVELVLTKPSRHDSWLIHCTGVICEKCTSIVHVQLGYSSVSVCASWVPRNMMEVHNNWCLQVLFHFFSHLTFWSQNFRFKF